MKRLIFTVPQRLRVVVYFLYFLILLWISTIPFKEIPKWALTSGFDILVHFSLYFGLTLLSCWTFNAEENRKRIKFIMLFAIILGLMMEILQILMKEGRNYEFSDILFNSLGALAGAGVFALVAAVPIKGEPGKF